MVRVRVPATTANLGPGFDTLGLALNLNNYVEIESQDDSRNGKESQLSCEVLVENQDLRIEIDSQDNLILKTLRKLSAYTGEKLSGVDITERLATRPALGLGSSAVAIVGTLLAANEYFQLGLSQTELRQLACQLEGHPDNVMAALEGGLTVSTYSEAKNMPVWEKIEPHESLESVVIIPELTSKTEEQRSVVPESFVRDDLIFNLGRTALLPLAINRGRTEKLKELMQDKMHQPYRCPQIPGWEEIKKAGYEAGALGIALSGAGPTIFVLTQNRAKNIGQAMCECWEKRNIESRYYLASLDNKGAHIVGK